MKQSILEVLMYLFEYYVDDDQRFGQDQEALREELQEAGFPHHEINRAFEWLEGLVARQEEFVHNPVPGHFALRVYTSQESAKLNAECRGFLLFLEQAGALDPLNRELVLDRVMELDDDEVSLEQLKWVVLMVLYNQPALEPSFVWMEQLVYGETGKLH